MVVGVHRIPSIFLRTYSDIIELWWGIKGLDCVLLCVNLYAAGYTVRTIRPSNSHGDSRFQVLSHIRFHGLASKSHGFPSAKSYSCTHSCIHLHLHVHVHVYTYLPVAEFYQPASWRCGPGITGVDLGLAINQRMYTSYVSKANLMRMRPAWSYFSVKSQGLRPKSQGFFMHIFQTSRFAGFTGWKVCTMYAGSLSVWDTFLEYVFCSVFTKTWYSII